MISFTVGSKEIACVEEIITMKAGKPEEVSFLVSTIISTVAGAALGATTGGVGALAGGKAGTAIGLEA